MLFTTGVLLLASGSSMAQDVQLSLASSTLDRGECLKIVVLSKRQRLF